MCPSDPDQASQLLDRAIESLQAGVPVDVAALRGPLADLLEDAKAGDDEGVINPYAEALARALLGQSD